MGKAQRRKQERAAGSGLAGALLAPLLLAVVVLVLCAKSFSVPFLTWLATAVQA